MFAVVTLGRRVAYGGADAVGRGVLAGLDAVLGSRYTDEVVGRILASRLVETVARDLARYRVLERVAEEVAVTEKETLESPAVERLVAQAIESRLLDTVVERLLESDDLWLLVDEIARSPSVTDAIGRQSVGFADQVAGQVRARSRRADDRVERVARRLLRRSEATDDDG